MTALEVAESMGIDKEVASAYMSGCSDLVECTQFVAMRKGSTVHIAVKVKGLGGRKLLRDCRAVLAQWFDKEPVLHAPVKPGNSKAVRLAEALGFHQYGATTDMVWLMQTKEHFNG